MHIWKRLFRIPTSLFDSLHAIFESMFARQVTLYRKPVHTVIRIVDFLIFVMYTGGYTCEATVSQLGIRDSSINLAMHEVLQKICHVCRESLPFLKSRKDVNVAMKGFKMIAGLPHCVRAIDGTRILWLKCPSDQHFDYQCYKGFTSVLIFACCTSDRRFMFIDVERPGYWETKKYFRSRH